MAKTSNDSYRNNYYSLLPSAKKPVKIRWLASKMCEATKGSKHPAPCNYVYKYLKAVKHYYRKSPRIKNATNLDFTVKDPGSLAYIGSIDLIFSGNRFKVVLVDDYDKAYGKLKNKFDGINKVPLKRLMTPRKSL